MSTAVPRPLSVLVAALGGQGGGVMADWLDGAAVRAGYPAQATSIPGVAQRTGATTYYVELFPERAPAADPVFCLYPDPGEVDLVAAMEPAEAARALQNGFVTAATTVITARRRVYATSEKVVAGDATMAAEPMIEALEKAAGRCIVLDVDGLAKSAGSQGNAVVFGAMIAAGVLPLTPDDALAAISATGVAVKANVAGFQAGMAAVESGHEPAPETRELRHDAAPPALAPRIAERFPPVLHDLVGHGAARLLDYQDMDYATLYLDRLEQVLATDSSTDKRLCAEVAARLAAWMAYEDVARVAQLKTRPGRLARIRAELGLADDEPMTVKDYLHPGRDELASAIPAGLGAKLPNWHWLERGISVRMPTGSAWGWLAMKTMAGLRRNRRASARFAAEHAAMERWLAALTAAAKKDVDLGVQTARLAVWARGYGAVRGRGLAQLEDLFATWDTRLEQDPAGLAASVAAALDAARTDPDAACHSKQATT